MNIRKRATKGAQLDGGTRGDDRADCGRPTVPTQAERPEAAAAEQSELISRLDTFAT
jgi:hypothetical protein